MLKITAPGFGPFLPRELLFKQLPVALHGPTVSQSRLRLGHEFKLCVI